MYEMDGDPFIWESMSVRDAKAFIASVQAFTARPSTYRPGVPPSLLLCRGVQPHMLRDDGMRFDAQSLRLFSNNFLHYGGLLVKTLSHLLFIESSHSMG